jgi:hypothetical protein
MDELRTNVVLHEMAHMWFGDLATQRWWDDLWLSESFAEFCGSHARVRLGLYPHAWSEFSVSEKIPGFAQDQLPSAHPVASNGRPDAGSVTHRPAAAGPDPAQRRRHRLCHRQARSAVAGHGALVGGRAA